MKTIVLLAAAVGRLLAFQDEQTKETRTFSGVNLVILDNVNGSIEATGYSGNDLRVGAVRTIRAESAERLEAAEREVKLDMQQSSTTVKLYVDGPFRCNCRDGGWHGHQGYSVNYDFKLEVPAAARLDLYTVNDGVIVVRNVEGDFDIGNVNGRIELTGMAGSGKAHTVNGPVKAVFVKNPPAATTFETVNGSLDLTFRPGLNADVHMKTMNGGMYTDFNVQRLPLAPESPERQNGRYVLRRGGATGVRIGAGGIEMNLKTLNGDIFIRDRERQ